MSASGPGLFADDLAADIRDLYVQFLRDGLTGEAATHRLSVDWRESIENPNEADVFWMALAATQSRYGRLEDAVLSKALEALHSGRDVAKWRALQPGLGARRARVLSELRRSLVGPQREPVPVKPTRPPGAAKVARGDLLRYQLEDRRSLVLRVVRAYDSQNVVYDLLVWLGTELPDDARIRSILASMPPIGPSTGIHDERRFWVLGVFKPVRDRVSVFGRIEWDDPEPGPLNVGYTTWEALPHVVWRSIEAYQGGPEAGASPKPVGRWSFGSHSPSP